MRRCTRWSMALFFAAWVLSTMATAHADQPDLEADGETAQQSPPSEPTALELGANIRTDFGVRAVRLDAAWRMPAFRALLVLDPMWWTDGRTATDITAFWRAGRIEPFLGWRLHTLPLVEGSQLQHNLVVGTALALPEFFDGRIGGQWGIEMSTMVIKHGGGVAGDRFRFDSARHYIDRVRFGMFARFHYNLELR